MVKGFITIPQKNGEAVNVICTISGGSGSKLLKHAVTGLVMVILWLLWLELYMKCKVGIGAWSRVDIVLIMTQKMSCILGVCCSV